MRPLDICNMIALVIQTSQAVGQEGRVATGGVPAVDGVDVTGGSAMDGTEDEGETKPMED